MPPQRNVSSGQTSERTSLNLKSVLGSFVLIGIFVVVSNRYCDARVAQFFHSMLVTHTWLAGHVAHIPDFITPIVLAITALSWITYFYLGNKARHISFLRLCQLMGTTVPVSAILVFVLKHIFGRVNTHTWVFSPDIYAYVWFQGGPHYIGFPSGHMAVFTSLVAAISRFYPRYRTAYFAALFLLGLVLIGTSYHFLSDVVAGAYLGVIVEHLTYQCLLFGRQSHRQNTQ